MNLTAGDLEALANQQNKPLFQTLYDLIETEVENVMVGTDVANMTQEKINTMGTCGVYFSSIRELLLSAKSLMDKGFIESGGVVAASLWERALTLRKILIDPEMNSQIHVDHQKAKTTPWSVFGMVQDIINYEDSITPKKDKVMELKMEYIQYTFLSSIKHGNPYTISYLNRVDRSSIESLFKVRPNDSLEDNDLKIYILFLVAEMVLEALTDYSRIYKTDSKSVIALRALADQIRISVKLQVPKIFITTPEEMGQAFWDHMVKLNSK